MNHRLRILTLLLLAAVAHADVLFVDAADFRYHGEWRIERGLPNHLGNGFLAVPGEPTGRPAVTAVTIPTAGTWRLWVRAKDFPEDRPGIRRFVVEVDGQPTAKEFGAHGNPDPGARGWAWEDGGTFDLPAGDILVALRAVTFFARCDAIAFTTKGDRPPSSNAQAAAVQATLPDIRPAAGELIEVFGPPDAVGDTPLARLANERVRVTFLPATYRGAETVALRVEARRGQDWTETQPATPEVYQVLRAEPGEPDEVLVDPLSIWPVWHRSVPRPVTVALGNAIYETAFGSGQWVTSAGEFSALLPGREVTVEDGAVRLTAAGEVGRAVAEWTLDGDDPLPRLALTLTPAQPGLYGLGYGAGPTLEREAVREVVCPLLYSYRRLPREPKLVKYEYAATPMAAFELAGDGGPVTRGVAFEPLALPQTWPDMRQVDAGFQLVDPLGQPRPTAWAPVPGAPDAPRQAGEAVELRLRLVALPEDWFAAWRRVATDLYGLSDYRRNDAWSLTDTALNVIDLLRDADASGWSADGAGWWNIESQSTVTQAAPLAVLSAALLTGDEALLAERAMPSLAYLLSRPSPHFVIDPDIDPHIGGPDLGGPTALYGAMVRLSAAEMARGYSPAFAALSVDAEGGPVRTRGYGKTALWEDALALWRFSGDERYRQMAIDDVQRYLDTWPAAQTDEPNPSAFYQLTYSGNWEGVQTAAEALGDPALMEQAAAIARRMITGLLLHPQVLDGEMTVHPGGEFVGNSIVWWKAEKPYLLGFEVGETIEELRYVPPARVPEERVPGWLPSVVGLGIEQPTTYRRPRTPAAPIVMSNWAPRLLRLADAVGEPMFATAAHNGLLGRWGNYPGYYVTGFNNVQRRPDYPYTGPDVSAIYHHHIPPFLGMVLDYLITDVEVRSQGAIAFPRGRQAGYAWFDNATFGHAPGRVGDTEGVWPWLRRGLVTLDTPLVNWLAGHTDDTVFVMLTNTANEPLNVRVALDAALTGGARGPVTWWSPETPAAPIPVADGAVTVPVAPQGLRVVQWSGCQVEVPLHTVPPPPAADAAATMASAESDLGTVHATWLGLDPDHAWVHVYSDHDGSRSRSGELTLTQGGAARRLADARWPLEFLVRVDGRQPADIAFTAIDGEGGRHETNLRVEPPMRR